jgi:7SK snRNA methylphosphate capping enzyme
VRGVTKHSDKEKFSKGNYLAYYGYRNMAGADDPRLSLFTQEMFEGKDVLDIGCNAGLVTLAVAKSFAPRRILGIDIDERLISTAKRNLKNFIVTTMGDKKYPLSLKTVFGPLEASFPQRIGSSFPHNVLFQMGNYVLDNEVELSKQREEYDVILALSVTKWLHFTHGDDGLRRAFRRMFRQLRPGGQLILEAQPWQSYRRKKKLTDKIFAAYQNIQFHPEQFNEYLLSPDVGFQSCHLLGTPCHQSKGFQRSIYVFTKAMSTSDQKPPVEQSKADMSASATATD